MFKQIAVIGSGTMGAGIAGQIANAGHRVLLLDLPTDTGTDPNAIANAAVDRLRAAQPAALMDKACADLIEVGNTRDDFDRLGDVDWVVEAVVEQLDIKRDLYRRLDDILPEDSIVTSNTSTIPISLLVEGRPLSFRRRFAITHFFNPVRYMRLLELVSGADTDPDVMERLVTFNDRELGKGVVVCGDTPGFLGNRVGVFALQVGIDEAIKIGLPIEAADALMGRPMGIPKTGVFGLYDLIGVDLMADVVRSLRSILPAEDAFHAVGAESDMINGMIAEGLTGLKGKGGFYRRGEDGQPLARELDSGQYRPRVPAASARVEAAAIALAEQREVLVDLITGDDAEATFCRNVLSRVLGYAASLLGDVSSSPQDIDDAMKLGFNWVRGPFEMIDALGTDTVAEFLQSNGQSVPPVLASAEPFYRVQAGELQVRHADGRWRAIHLPAGAARFHLVRRTLEPIASNAGASVYALPDNLRLIEFHSKANALTDDSMAMVAAAADDPGRGILVHNDAQHYSAGVDLNAFLALINAEDWSGIDAFLHRFQQAVKALRDAPVPVVGAPSGLSLGGGFEVLMHCDRLVVHANSVLGLVESAVGLVPSGGGVKETLRRWHESSGDWSQAAWNTWMNIGYGATGSSPQEATRLHYYRPGIDTSVMNRDRLLSAATAVIDQLTNNYKPRTSGAFQRAGGDILTRMDQFMSEGVAREQFTAHDRTVAMAVGSIVCVDAPNNQIADEDELFELERKAFITLAKTPQTRARIEHLLAGGGSLRN